MKCQNLKIVCILFTLFLSITLSPVAVWGVLAPEIDHEDLDAENTPVPSPLPVPSNYRHRPIVEFFTGLSCPSCMNGPHGDLEKLWEEDRENEEQPFTYIAFHELNGGGVDDLATEDSKERMRFYQPGVSGTPDAEFDGGYIKLGGLSTNSINYQSASQAVEDCKTRYTKTINPLRPIQSLRNDFKFVELFVDQIFTGDGFAISVEARYLGTDAIISMQNLRGSLYVFMVEENVEAYSTVLDEFVINHNVFRDYAISDQQFTLTADETYSITMEWKIPEAKVPIKPGDITAVAAIYDLDDTSSSDGNKGNDAQVPRCIQSATPISTAFDKNNDLPVINDISTEYNDDLVINAKLDDANGISKAYLLYNTESQNSTAWSYEEMTVAGEEICDDQGVCYAYSDSTASVKIPVENGEDVYFMILVYDGSGLEYGGLGAQGKSEIYNFTTAGGKQNNLLGDILSWGALGVILGICVVLLVIIFITKTRKGGGKSLRAILKLNQLSN